ncbi:hypothetical protein BV121_1305 [Haemophilus influenzae]|nr:hypothetical protein BV121_1305 [Haemophilus influenzae]AVJ03549.1 hypothetical protein BV131_1261 [Haemophilus influenzae]AVJ05291.1 hypothetical protein BV134_1262 [Haemophilus influenzae]
MKKYYIFMHNYASAINKKSQKIWDFKNLIEINRTLGLFCHFKLN